MEPQKPTNEMAADDRQKNTATATATEAEDMGRSAGLSTGQHPDPGEPTRDWQEGIQRLRDGSGSGQSAEKEGLDEAWYRLGFSIARSLRYHAKRRAFFERCNHLNRALLAIAGAGTVTAVLNGSRAAIWIGTVVAVMTALDLVFDFSRRAMDYDTLYKRFADLGVEVALADRTAANCRQYMVKRLLIEKEEPSVLSVLNVICSNEERKARGFDDFYKVRGLQRWFCNFFDIGPLTFELVKDDA